MILVYGISIDTHCYNRRLKSGLTVFSLFPKMFSKTVFQRVPESQDCVVEG